MDATTRRAQHLTVDAEALSAAGRTDRPGEQAVLVHIHRDASRLMHVQLRGSWAADHMIDRDLPAGPDVGYAQPGWTSLVDQLRSLGYRDRDLLAAGVAITTRRDTLVDRFRDRLMLTVRNAAGEPVAFVGRAHPDTGPDVPRYLNSPTTSIWSKHEVLFGLGGHDTALRGGATPVLVEGPLDALAVTTAGAGAYIGLAPLGTALTGDHVQVLQDVANLRDRDLLLGFDGDAAGVEATVRATVLARRLTDQIHVLPLPPGGDPAAAHQYGQLGDRLHGTATHRSATDVVLEHELALVGDRLDTIERRVAMMRHCAPIIAAAQHGSWGPHIVALASRLDLAVDTVNAAVVDAVSGTMADRAASATPRPGASAAQATAPPASVAAAAPTAAVPAPSPARRP